MTKEEAIEKIKWRISTAAEIAGKGEDGKAYEDLEIAISTIQKLISSERKIMTGPYKVITLCGSTKYQKEFLEVQRKLTLEGNIVLSLGLFSHSEDKSTFDTMDKETFHQIKTMLDEMHRYKINMADEIFVINVDGYIGESTKSEIEYAKKAGKVINYYLEPEIKEDFIIN